MPTWTPNWNPVVIDEAGLLDAIADCTSAIGTIEEGRGSLAPFVSAARDGWEGPARLDFDEHYASFERQVDAVVAQLRQSIDGFHREIAAAHEEQARRWAEQQRWQEELAEEQRRIEAARAAGAGPIKDAEVGPPTDPESFVDWQF